MSDAVRAILDHLWSCDEAVYRVVGAAAPTLGDDAAVVRAHEFARVLGALALELRGALGDAPGEPFTPLVDVLEAAVAGDPDGRLLVATLSQVVGPRLLVTLRDARVALGSDPAGALVDHGATALVAQLHALAATMLAGARYATSEPLDATSAAPGSLGEGVRRLAEVLDAAGFAESFGVAR